MRIPRKWNRFLAGGLTFLFVLSGSVLLADRKKDRKREKSLRTETSDRYLKKWMKQDVGYIISAEEKEAFKRLTTDDERYQFIEQFWLRRDPTPDTPDNEAKLEHYRRIAFANERFASGRPGWETDRGRIYITFGPPDEIERHSAGGTYDRPPEEGGGQTITFPFEVWRYRYIEGRALGEEVRIEFVDPSFSGEYRLALRSKDKDAIYYTPQIGLTTAEMAGMAYKEDRDIMGGTGYGMGGNLRPYQQFDRLRQHAALTRAPKVRFKDLETVINTKLSFNLLPFRFTTDFFKITEDMVLTPITIRLRHQDLTFQNQDGVERARVNIFGRISTITGRVVEVFEDVISQDVPASLMKEALERDSLYQKSLNLRSGRYKLELVLKDIHSGNIGTQYYGMVIPHFPDDSLASSSIILADTIQPLPPKQMGSGMFVIGTNKVHPNVEDRFDRKETMGIYFQVYNLTVDNKTHKPSASVQFVLKKGDKEITRLTKTEEELAGAAQQMTLEQHLALSALDPGSYQLVVNVTDNLANRSLSKAAKFEVR